MKNIIVEISGGVLQEVYQENEKGGYQPAEEYILVDHDNLEEEGKEVCYKGKCPNVECGSYGNTRNNKPECPECDRQLEKVEIYLIEKEDENL